MIYPTIHTLKRPVAIGLQPVSEIFSEHATATETVAQPTQLATAVHTQPVAVRFGCRSFAGPATGL